MGSIDVGVTRANMPACDRLFARFKRFAQPDMSAGLTSGAHISDTQFLLIDLGGPKDGRAGKSCAGDSSQAMNETTAREAVGHNALERNVKRNHRLEFPLLLRTHY